YFVRRPGLWRDRRMGPQPRRSVRPRLGVHAREDALCGGATLSVPAPGPACLGAGARRLGGGRAGGPPPAKRPPGSPRHRREDAARLAAAGRPGRPSALGALASAGAHLVSTGGRREDQRDRALPEVLAALLLEGRVVTADAMLCQREIAQEIVARGHYLLIVK